MKKFRLKVESIRLSVKLRWILIFTCVILLVGELLSRQIVYDVYNEKLHIQIMQVAMAYANRLETEIDKMNKLSFSILGDTGIQDRLSTINQNLDDWNWEEKQDISSTLKRYSSFFDYEISASILLADNKRIGTFGKTDKQDAYVRKALEKQGRISIYVENNRIGLFREIRQISGLTMKHLGILFLEMNLDDVIGNLQRNFEKIDEQLGLYIFSEEECIYASSDTDEIPEAVKDVTLTKNRFIVPYTSSELGWTFVVSVPYDEISHSIGMANVRATILCVIVAVLVCVCSSLLIGSLLPHIDYLLKKFEQFSNGKLPDPKEYPVYEGRKDEFGQLHNQFDKMALEYNRMTQQSYDNMMLLKEAQFRQLQQQIRPHFLFNTLSAIVWTAQENNDMETAKIADALGHILRQSFCNTEKLITVREERKVLKDYLYIQKFRYQERLEVEQKFEEEILDVKIPSFTLQPIVENAIIHVVEKTLDKCIIKINGTIQEKVAILTVEDNGGALDADILKKLESGEVLPKGNGVGLSNVNSRIQLAFSKEYGLEVYSEKGLSRVIIKIPVS